MTLLHTLLLASLFTALSCAAHLLVCRFTRGRRLMTVALGTGAFFFTAACSYQYFDRRFDPVLLYLVPTLWLTYMVFLINMVNSVTLKLLHVLAEAPGGRLEAGSFAAALRGDAGIAPRVEAMIANGLVVPAGGALSLTPRGRLLLLALRIMRALLRAGGRTE